MLFRSQMVVDGRTEFVGSDAAAARRAIEKTLTAPHGVLTIEVARSGDPDRVALQVDVAALPRLTKGDRADIILAVTERGLTTDVKRGENHGKVLKHAPVVRYLATIGQIAGDGVTTGSARADVALAAGWQRDRLAIVSFVQEFRGRAILAAASQPLKNARQ